MMKLKNILVPHAGTPGGDIALRKAIYFAKLSGATINILHVVEPILKPPIFTFSKSEVKSMQKELDATTNRIKSDMEQAMKRRATLCHSKNINATYKVSVGLPEQEIIKFAKYYNTDLIIMSKRRKIRGFKGILKLGSVSRKILESVKRSVLLFDA
ncbi:MAG: UspA domain-containing protein [Thaumarchaeota archaeon CSP1-1]|nr:MAG: UspA domain-containing protein [Thaumarchaeota archaeon CSP1-1]